MRELQKFKDQLATLAEVQECYSVTGDFDYVLKVVARDLKTLSDFLLKTLAQLPPIDGVAFATAEAGIKYKGRTDLMVARLAEGTTAAGVLTRSKTCSAPVLWCRESLKTGRARALVVNSGNANAFTGKRGSEATRLLLKVTDAIMIAPALPWPAAVESVLRTAAMPAAPAVSMGMPVVDATAAAPAVVAAVWKKLPNAPAMSGPPASAP